MKSLKIKNEEFHPYNGINRSGGSLLARLLEETKVVSYPMEVGFKFKEDLFGFVDKLTGSPKYIPDLIQK